MNKINRYILFSIMIFSAGSCKKFLDVTPQGAITEAGVSTPDKVDGLVLAAYAWLPHEGTINSRMSPWLADIKSDDSYKGGGGIGIMPEAVGGSHEKRSSPAVRGRQEIPGLANEL